MPLNHMSVEPFAQLHCSFKIYKTIFSHFVSRRSELSSKRASEGLSPELFDQTLFEWAYPQVARWCRDTGRPYPGLSEEGELLEELPRTVKLRC